MVESIGQFDASRPEVPGKTARRKQITRTLRREIVQGVRPPGCRLPTRADLERAFGASPATVQLALNDLAKDGFTVARGRAGTFVAPYPPHLFQYGWVFRRDPSDQARWTLFDAVLNAQARFMLRARPKARINAYYGVDGRTEHDDYRRLCEDVATERLAGLLFFEPPGFLRGSPVLDSEVPKVVLTGTPYEGIPAVDLDLRSELNRALEWLKSRGRKRVSVICSATQTLFDDGFLDSHLHQAIAEHGMVTGPHWILPMHPSLPDTARHVCQLLFRGPAQDRPDALLINDDHLVEQATLGIAASGVRVGEELDIVAHCNFPSPPKSYVPVQRLGFDARELLLAMTDVIDAQRRGEPVRSITWISAKFQDEVPR